MFCPAEILRRRARNPSLSPIMHRANTEAYSVFTMSLSCGALARPAALPPR